MSAFTVLNKLKKQSCQLVCNISPGTVIFAISATKCDRALRRNSNQCRGLHERERKEAVREREREQPPERRVSGYGYKHTP